MASLKFYLDTRRLKADGSALLKISVTHSRAVRYISLGFSLKPSLWDSKRGRITDAHPSHLRLNNALSRIMLHAEDAFISVLSSGARYDLADLYEAVAGVVRPEERVLNPETPEPSLLLGVFERFLGTKTKTKTRGSYAATLKHLRAFAAPGLRLDDVSRAWLIEFDVHLSKTATSPNARAVYMRNLRAVFNFAIDEGLTTNYPFRKFHIKTVKTAKRSLSVEDLRRLFSADIEPWQEPYLDFFKLSFMLIGINAVDLLGLVPGSLRSGRIVYNRSKTARLYSLKAEPEVLELIEKYRGSKYLLSIMDTRVDYEQFVRQCNHALKSIGTHSCAGAKSIGAPLFPNLTTYWARHSWATIAASLDIPKETIAAALGHGSQSVTDIYIDFDLQKVDDANRRVLDWVLYGKT